MIMSKSKFTPEGIELVNTLAAQIGTLSAASPAYPPWPPRERPKDQRDVEAAINRFEIECREMEAAIPSSVTKPARPRSMKAPRKIGPNGAEAPDIISAYDEWSFYHRSLCSLASSAPPAIPTSAAIAVAPKVENPTVSAPPKPEFRAEHPLEIAKIEEIAPSADAGAVNYSALCAKHMQEQGAAMIKTMPGTAESPLTESPSPASVAARVPAKVTGGGEQNYTDRCRGERAKSAPKKKLPEITPEQAENMSWTELCAMGRTGKVPPSANTKHAAYAALNR